MIALGPFASWVVVVAFCGGAALGGIAIALGAAAGRADEDMERMHRGWVERNGERWGR